uniref:Putative kazrin-a n=1 Tax=Ixodes ricinus TaxID=34613 RepID=A0A0K8RMZ3_IXORI
MSELLSLLRLFAACVCFSILLGGHFWFFRDATESLSRAQVASLQYKAALQGSVSYTCLVTSRKNVFVTIQLLPFQEVLLKKKIEADRLDILADIPALKLKVATTEREKSELESKVKKLEVRCCPLVECTPYRRVLV